MPPQTLSSAIDLNNEGVDLFRNELGMLEHVSCSCFRPALAIIREGVRRYSCISTAAAGGHLAPEDAPEYLQQFASSVSDSEGNDDDMVEEKGTGNDMVGVIIDGQGRPVEQILRNNSSAVMKFGSPKETEPNSARAYPQVVRSSDLASRARSPTTTTAMPQEDLPFSAHICSTAIRLPPQGAIGPVVGSAKEAMSLSKAVTAVVTFNLALTLHLLSLSATETPPCDVRKHQLNGSAIGLYEVVFNLRADAFTSDTTQHEHTNGALNSTSLGLLDLAVLNNLAVLYIQAGNQSMGRLCVDILDSRIEQIGQGVASGFISNSATMHSYLSHCVDGEQ